MAEEVGIASKVVELVMMVVVTSGGFGLSVKLLQRSLEETEKRINKSLQTMQGENESDHQEILKYSRTAVEALKLDIDDLYDKHHLCREDLPRSYAPKDTVEQLWSKTDRLTADMAYMQGKQNGAAVSGRKP